MSKIYFPQYKKGKKGLELEKDASILDHIRKLDIEINAECGGVGTCGECVVRIEKGAKALNRLTNAEKIVALQKNERLACQAKIEEIRGEIVVFVKETGKYKILKTGLGKKIDLDPVISVEDDKVFYGEEVLDKYRGRIYGLAVDVGTTTLVFEIVDLQTGRIIETIAKTNPQIIYGGDVVSRIEYTMVNKKTHSYLKENETAKKLKELQKSVIGGINKSLKKFKAFSPYIYEAVVVGNSTMRNIFFGIDISSLGLKPYEPLHKQPIVKNAEELGFAIFPKAKVYGAPLIGGHAGSDALADILTSEIYKSDKVSMLIDIGTNGEVILGNSKRLISATLPAGGAYEGANVSSGVGAVEGAIKNIKIKDGKVTYSTIGNKKPVGICGSGLIDLLAELLEHGIMSKKARLNQDFPIFKNIKLTQADVYGLINAKASLKTDQFVLLKHYGINVKDLDKICLSGGFGNYINVKNAIKIGLLPDAEDKMVKIGNGALEGAREMLVSRKGRKTAEQIACKTEHIKTNELEKNFAHLLAENMYFEN